MSNYIQLLGSDAPESCGGCCYYGKFSSTSFHNSIIRKESIHSSTKTESQNFTSDKYKPSQMACKGVDEEDGYLFFNCPEGTQRFSSEGKIKLTKIKCFLFTRWGSFDKVKGNWQSELKVERETEQRGQIEGNSSSSSNYIQQNNKTNKKEEEGKQCRREECTHNYLDLHEEVRCSNENKLKCCDCESPSTIKMEKNIVLTSNEEKNNSPMQQFSTPHEINVEKEQERQERELHEEELLESEEEEEQEEEWEEHQCEELEEEDKHSCIVNESAASAVMGLPGLLFTINDAGVKETTLFGPSSVFNVYERFKATREHYKTGYGLQYKTTGREEEEEEESLLKENVSENCTIKNTTVTIQKINELAGVERFIYVMRKHFFTYRTMKFKQLMSMYYTENAVEDHNATGNSNYHYKHDCCHSQKLLNNTCHLPKHTSQINTENSWDGSNLPREESLSSSSIVAESGKKLKRITHPEAKLKEFIEEQETVMQYSNNNSNDLLPLWETTTSLISELQSKESKAAENMKANDVTKTYEKVSVYRSPPIKEKIYQEKCNYHNKTKEEISTLSEHMEKSRIIASLLLDDQTLLIAFRVSGKASIQPAFPICRNGKLPHQEHHSEEHQSASCDANKCIVDDNYCNLCTDSIATAYAADTSDLIISYAIVTAPRRKFDPAKARKLGVCHGPDFGHLKRGRCVRNAEGDEIQPDQVTVTTIGSLHLFITLILDGLHPGQVRRAVEELLGNNVPCSEECDECNKNNEEGELRRYLREKYPSFIFYTDNVANDENNKVNNQTTVESVECDADKDEKEEMEVIHSNTSNVEPISSSLERVVKNYVESDHDENLEISAKLNKTKEKSGATRFRNAIGKDNKIITEDKVHTNVFERNLIIVMNVVHLQPHSYFTNLFAKYKCDSKNVNKGNLYEKYTEYLFRRVSKRVLRSTEAMLNFSKENFEENTVSHEQRSNNNNRSKISNYDECTKSKDVSKDANNNNNTSHKDVILSKDNLMHVVTTTRSKHSRSDMNASQQECNEVQNILRNKDNILECTNVTTHLFTSFLYVHYTAFPTALTHRYHLHFIAPFLFPLIDGKCILENIDSSNMETSINNDQCKEKHHLEKPKWCTVDSVNDDMTKVQFWPYGCRWHTLPVWVNREIVTNNNNTSTQTTESKSTSQLFSSSSSVKSLFHSNKELTLVDKLAALIKYPSAWSANKLLSESFKESILKKLISTNICKGHTLINRYDNNYNNCEDESIHRNATCNCTDKVIAPQFLQQKQNVYRNDNDKGGALVFLGTGSAIPGKYRNVSSAYLELHIPSKCMTELDECFGKTYSKNRFTTCYQDIGDNLRRAIIILDFGEGSMGQLRSMLKVDNSAKHWEEMSNITQTCQHQSTENELKHSQHSKSILWKSEWEREQMYSFVRDILFVFISHSHADHHLGLLSLLELRHQALQELQSYTCSHHGEGHSTNGVNQKINSTELGKMPLTNKLLIVCPVEVESFILDMWATTKPYSDWLQTECIFDTFTAQSPTFVVQEQCQEQESEEQELYYNEKHNTPQVMKEEKHEQEEEQEEEEEEEANQMRKTNFDDSKVKKSKCVKGKQESASANCCEAMTNLDHKTECHNNESDANNPVAEQEKQNATLPHLSALCAMLNDRLCQTYMNELELNQHATFTNQWAAEVCPVDHPANAHALLFRFPRFDFTSDEIQSKTKHNRENSNVNVNDINNTTNNSKRDSKYNYQVAGSYSYCREYVDNDTAEHITSTDKSISDKYFTKNKNCCTIHSRTFLFSGDTRPSAYLVNQCRRFCRNENLSICLHEATFGPGYENEAKDKRHSTLTEALDVASSMNAETIVLNHFSQRYPKLPASVKEQIEGTYYKKNNEHSAESTLYSNDCYSCNADHNDKNNSDNALPLYNTIKGAPELGNNITYDDSNSIRDEEDQEERTSTRAEKDKMPATKIEGNNNNDNNNNVLLWENQKDVCAAHTDNGRIRDFSNTTDTKKHEMLIHCPSKLANICFAFDMMRISFADMESRVAHTLTPLFIELSEEYDSWGVSTTKRLRERYETQLL